MVSQRWCHFKADSRRFRQSQWPYSIYGDASSAEIRAFVLLALHRGVSFGLHNLKRTTHSDLGLIDIASQLLEQLVKQKDNTSSEMLESVSRCLT